MQGFILCGASERVSGFPLFFENAYYVIIIYYYCSIL